MPAVVNSIQKLMMSLAVIGCCLFGGSCLTTSLDESCITFNLDCNDGAIPDSLDAADNFDLKSVAIY